MLLSYGDDHRRRSLSMLVGGDAPDAAWAPPEWQAAAAMHACRSSDLGLTRARALFRMGLTRGPPPRRPDHPASSASSRLRC